MQRALTIAMAVFLLVVISATLITFILPESFASSTRLLVNPAANNPRFATAAWSPAFAQTQVQLISSEKVLGDVAVQLGLADQWAQRYGMPGSLKTPEVLAMLKRHFDVRAVPNTSVITITAYSERPEEAAQLANGVAAAYAAFCPTQSPPVQAAIVERAAPGMRPVRPNKPLNIALGIGVGLLFGFGVGSLVYMLGLRPQPFKADQTVSPPMTV